MQSLLIEAAGWIGAGLILGSYILVSTGRREGRSRTFRWMNIVDAAGFGVAAPYSVRPELVEGPLFVRSVAREARRSRTVLRQARHERR